MNKIFIPNNYPAFCRVIILALLLSGHDVLFGQTNLVNNYSFEDYVTCPSRSVGNYPHPRFWYYATANGPSAYYNSCTGDTLIGVPKNCPNGCSYQLAKSGNAYVVSAYLNGVGSNQRNYYQTKLKDSLRAGHCYYAEYYVSLLNSIRLACNNIGMLFTQNPVYVDTIVSGFGVLPAVPQIVNYGNPIISDTLNWVKVNGVFIAQGGEQYLTLGNFKYDNQTNYIVTQPTGYTGAGYYIDDVSVHALDSMPLKADVGLDTTITLGDSAFIGSLTSGIPSITWYNSSGTVINTTAPGFYVSPTASTFYILEQTVCGYTSRDTINITINLLPLHWLAFTASQFFSSISSASLYPPWGAGGPGDGDYILFYTKKKK